MKAFRELRLLGNGDLPGVPIDLNVGGATSYPFLDGVGSLTA